jgi:hypothetical protein
MNLVLATADQNNVPAVEKRPISAGVRALLMTKSTVSVTFSPKKPAIRMATEAGKNPQKGRH